MTQRFLFLEDCPQVTALKADWLPPDNAKHVLEGSLPTGLTQNSGQYDFDKLVGMGPFNNRLYRRCQNSFRKKPYYWKVDGNGVKLPTSTS